MERLGVGDALELRHRVAPRQRHRLVGRNDNLGGDVDAAAAAEDVEPRVRGRLLLAELRVGGAGPAAEQTSSQVEMHSSMRGEAQGSRK